jgi:hypothetical protein
MLESRYLGLANMPDPSLLESDNMPDLRYFGLANVLDLSNNNNN